MQKCHLHSCIPDSFGNKRTLKLQTYSCTFKQWYRRVHPKQVEGSGSHMQERRFQTAVEAFKCQKEEDTRPVLALSYCDRRKLHQKQAVKGGGSQNKREDSRQCSKTSNIKRNRIPPSNAKNFKGKNEK